MVLVGVIPFLIPYRPSTLCGGTPALAVLHSRGNFPILSLILRSRRPPKRAKSPGEMAGF